MSGEFYGVVVSTMLDKLWCSQFVVTFSRQCHVICAGAPCLFIGRFVCSALVRSVRKYLLTFLRYYPWYCGTYPTSSRCCYMSEKQFVASYKVLLLVLFLERTKFIVLGTKDPEGYEQKAEIRIMCYYFKASRVTSRPSTFSQFPTELLTADVYGWSVFVRRPSSVYHSITAPY